MKEGSYHSILLGESGAGYTVHTVTSPWVNHATIANAKPITMLRKTSGERSRAMMLRTVKVAVVIMTSQNMKAQRISLKQ